MLIDILCLDNYMNYNVKIAQMFGLNVAVYLSALLNIYSKVITKKKFLNNSNYFAIDRKYIKERTTLTEEEQIDIDKKLKKLNILEINEYTNNIVKLNIDSIASVLDIDDKTIQKTLSSIVKKVTKPKKTNDNQDQITKVKSFIHCADSELTQLYNDWIDAVFAKGNVLTIKMVQLFQDKINEFAKGSTDLKIELLNTAIITGYKDADYVISTYQRKQSLNNSSSSRKQPKQELKLSDLTGGTF